MPSPRDELTPPKAQPTQLNVQPGLVIADRYELEEPLGEGAMGAVWRARHMTLGTAVAVKVIRREAALNRDALQRFEREAVLAARIRSAHVVQALDHGHHDGLPYIVMEYLVGESLRDRLQGRGRLTLAETGLVVRHVCRALAQAHGVGLVHRDIKPENIFISPGEEDDEEIVKVLDFGVAKVTDELGLEGVAPTQTGALLGTPFYVSPEQARGLKLVGPPADMWSLGVVAFECLAGERPFVAHAMGPLMAKIIHGPIPVPSQVCPAASIPAAVDGWVARALCREPEGRFASAREMSKTFIAAAQIVAAPSLVGTGGRADSVDASATLLLDSSAGDLRSAMPEISSDLAKTAVLPDQGPPMPLADSRPVPAAPPAAAVPASASGVEHAKMPSNESLIARPWPDAIVIPQKSRAPLFVGVAAGVAVAVGVLAWLLLSEEPSNLSTSGPVSQPLSAEPLGPEREDLPPEPTAPEPTAEPSAQPEAQPEAESSAEPTSPSTAVAAPPPPRPPSAWPGSPPTSPPTATAPPKPPATATAQPWQFRKEL